MYLSVDERKIKILQPILKTLPFLSQDFDTLPFIFRFNLARLCYFEIHFSLSNNFDIFTDTNVSATILTKTP